MMNRRWLFALLTLTLTLGSASLVIAAERLKPFVLATQDQTSLEEKAVWVRQVLQDAGFEIAGEYVPYEGALVLVATSRELQELATRSENGGFGAAIRVSVTRVGDTTQVAYTNPRYQALAYRMRGDLSDVAAQLEEALGATQIFGSEDGLKPKKIRKYNYMIGMQKFDDTDELALHANHEAAIAAVEDNLARGAGGATKVYRIDLPGRQESVFGVALSQECSSDAFIMGHIDFNELRQTAHLPYELLVTDGKVIALNARFRIAVNFPDLSMMGEHSFMKIKCAPGAIEDALDAVAGGDG